jgi:hypothetical protein
MVNKNEIQTCFNYFEENIIKNEKQFKEYLKFSELRYRQIIPNKSIDVSIRTCDYFINGYDKIEISIKIIYTTSSGMRCCYNLRNNFNIISFMRYIKLKKLK